MSVAPLPANESRRLATLRAYNILDTPPEREFDDLAELAAAICGTPIAVVTLVDEHRQWFKSRFGLETAETPRDFAFCAHAIVGEVTFIVPDTHRDGRFRENPLVTGPPYIRFYAGARLVVPTGECLGTLAVIDREPRILSTEQIRALETLARHVATQLELRRRGDRFRTLSDAAPVGIYETDVDGRCLYTNPAWEQISGLSLEESRGHDWARAVHPDDRERVLREWTRAVAEKREFGLEYRIALPTGEVKTIDSQARAIVGPSGEIEGYVGTVRAVEAALRASREQLERVLEGSTDGFWDWNVATGEVQFSRRWAQMLGYEVEELEPHVRTWETMVHPDDAANVSRVLNAHFEGRLPHYETEHRVRAKSGAWKWILDRGKVTERAADGAPLRMAGTHSDIDERKRAEEVLERFFELSIDLLCIAGLDGYFKRVNPAFEEIFGYSTEEMLAKPFLDLVHPDDRESTIQEMNKLAAGATTHRFENRYVCRDGSIKRIAWTASPHVEEGLVYGAGRDVTRETLAVRALAESEERYRDLFENATDIIQAVGPDGRFLYVNRARLNTLGYEAHEVEKLTIFDVIDPEKRDVWRNVRKEVLGGRNIPKLVAEFITKSGERRTIEGSLSCRIENDQAVSTRGIFRDITERRKAEEELRARESAMRSMIQSSLSGIVTFDQAGLIETVNPAAERILGYSAEGLEGKSVAMLMAQPPQDFAQFRRRAVDEALGRITEWEILRGDGRVIQLELALFEFHTARGRQLAGNIQDVSQRREVERMKREFVSTISHELRTPLTSIRGSLDLLQGEVLGELSPGAREVAAIAHRNTTRLIGLINDILDLDRLDSGKLELHLEPVEVDTLFRTAIDSVRGFAEQNGISIERAMSRAIVIADLHRMTQVLVNLLSNAIKFSPSGSTVSLTAEEECDQVVIRVADEGRGISPELHDRIFDRFQQVEASDSRSKGGSGLGLAISRAIVEQHRGRIGVVSEEGRGSTFWVRLASARANDATAFTAERPIGALILTAATAANLESTLRNEGYPVVTFDTVDHAASAFRGGTLSILIVELGGNGEGDALLSRIRNAEWSTDTPIVALASNGDAIEWFDDNLTVFLSKADDAALLAAIRKFAGESTASDVILIEDDRALLGVLRRQLENEGMRVRTATTGGAAIAMIRRAPPKLIVLDVGLPDIDGFDVVSVLHRDEHLRRLPLLVYTGRYLASEDRERLRLGPTRFLTKATDDDHELRRVVVELIRSVSAESGS